MLKQAKHLSTAGQLLLINVKMLSVDLDVFNAEIVARLDTYIHLQTMLLKQVRTVMLFVLYRCVNLLLLSFLYFMMFYFRESEALCFYRRWFVCLSVCLFVTMITK